MHTVTFRVPEVDVRANLAIDEAAANDGTLIIEKAAFDVANNDFSYFMQGINTLLDNTTVKQAVTDVRAGDDEGNRVVSITVNDQAVYNLLNAAGPLLYR